MSRLTIPKNPFQALDHDYTRLNFSFLIDIQGHITQKPDFSLPQVKSNLTHTFFPWLGQPEPFWAKKTQTSLKLIKTLSFDRNITWTISDPKEPVKTVHICCYNTSSQHPLQIKVPNLNKNEKMEKELWSFHHAFGIFE